MKLANKDKLKKNDRILVLKVIDGEKPLSSIGMVDKTLLTGGNVMHAKHDPQTGQWHVAYEHGAIPEAISGKWMGYQQLLFDVEAYLKKRNIMIEKVID